MVKVSITLGSFGEVHYSTSEAAKLLGLTADTVKCYCNRKQIRGRKLLGKGGPWLVPKSAIDEYKRVSSEVGRPKKCQQDRVAASPSRKQRATNR